MEKAIERLILIVANSKSNVHWNYFIALEDDLASVSRYIEFCTANMNVFSIELAHLLFAAASEVDVLAKRICDIVEPSKKRRNIDDYRSVLVNSSNIPIRFDKLFAIQLTMPRYGLAFTPWENWAQDKNPDWWRNYNNVKHARDEYFHQATLHNAINSVGALMIMNLYYHRFIWSPDLKRNSSPSDITQNLKPLSNILQFPIHYYKAPHLRDSF